MKWSWRIGTVFGIGVFVHWTFLILLAWIGLAHAQHGATAMVLGIGLVLVLFGIVLLHELGHCLTARRFGIQTKDIILLPIGGLARLERMPDDPRQEFWVAIAGPAVNVVLAIAAYVIVQLQGSVHMLDFPQIGGGFWDWMLKVNTYLVLFNMLPAFPMDGGRVLRSLLAQQMDYARATRVAASIGQFMALGFVFAGFFYNPFLIFIGVFVWLGAEAEASMAQVRSTLSGFTVRHAMITRFRCLEPLEPLSSVIDDILAGFQQDFPVVENGTILGILSYNRLVKALSDDGPQTPVRSAMNTEFETCSPEDPLEKIMPRLQASSCPTFPVLEHGKLVGLLTFSNLSEFIVLRGALHQNAEPPPLPRQ
ncbi:MAG: protease [Candidatus Hydrogenedentota bacterium]